MQGRKRLGYFITARRKRMGLTQAELAHMIGVSKSAIAKWETNGGLPDRDNLKRLSEIMNVSGVSKSAIAKWETNGGLPDRDNLKRLSEIMNVSVDELYRVIHNADIKGPDIKFDITPDVIAALESYGYRVIRTEGETEGRESGKR